MITSTIACNEIGLEACTDNCYPDSSQLFWWRYIFSTIFCILILEHMLHTIIKYAKVSNTSGVHTLLYLSIILNIFVKLQWSESAITAN